MGAICQRFGDALPIRLIMGGLRPGTTKPLDNAGKRTIWEHVREASGQLFDMQFFDRDAIVYDTEPASKAIVVARRSSMEKGFAYLGSVQAAFYAENRDVTDQEVLADLATEVGLDREGFLTAFRSEEAKQETWADFGIARRAGITGFPTLLAECRDGQLRLGSCTAGAPLPAGHKVPWAIRTKSGVARKAGEPVTLSFDLFWSFRSPYCYIALDRILTLVRTYDVGVNVRPVYPIAIRRPEFFKRVNPSYRRYHMLDTNRLAEYHGIPYRRPVPDPII